jgi:deoxyribodipyrimidine photo-lyase
MAVNPKRIRLLKAGKESRKGVAYWMSRDQRVHDNWALLYAQELALQKEAPLAVIFYLAPRFLDAAARQYQFMLSGLRQMERSLAKLEIPMHVLGGDLETALARFIDKHRVGTLITDFSPLKITRGWKETVARSTKIPFYEVDAHNIVPCWTASPKQEYGAYTIRPKITSLLPEFLEEFPPLKKHPYPWPQPARPVDWKKASAHLGADEGVGPVGGIKPGERAGTAKLMAFLGGKLAAYDRNRNDPGKDGQSGLSPYLHFGQVASQRVALEVQKRDRHLRAQEAFLEQMVIRRELADNFCFYNRHYDSFDGFPRWARETLNEHQGDERKHLYGPEQLESALTHDPLWNAAQTEMTTSGMMHGYLRMYWAKKILEWTVSASEAVQIAIRLNDKYELDGRDPNGYAGIAWCLGGVHDRPWFEREIFGKIRYMSFEGCRRKFSIKAYIERVNRLKRNPV